MSECDAFRADGRAVRRDERREVRLLGEPRRRHGSQGLRQRAAAKDEVNEDEGRVEGGSVGRQQRDRPL